MEGLDNIRVWMAVGAAGIFRFLRAPSQRPWWHRMISAVASAIAAVALFPFAIEISGLSAYSTAAPAVAAAIALVAETIADRLLLARSLSDVLAIVWVRPEDPK